MEEYATVSSTGLVTGHKKTTTPVTIKATAGTKTAYFDVTVLDTKHIAKVDVTPSEWPDPESESPFIVGQGYQLGVTLTSNQTNLTGLDTSVTWESKNKNIATVTPEGYVQAAMAGKTDIIATSNENPKIFGICTVTVSDPAITLKGFTLSTDTGKTELEAGDVVTLKATYNPTNVPTELKGFTAVIKTYTPKTAGEVVGEYNNTNQKFTAKNPGKVVIEATSSADGYSSVKATITLTVVPKKPAKVTDLFAGYVSTTDKDVKVTWSEVGTTTADYYKVVADDGVNKPITNYVKATTAAEGSGFAYKIPATSLKSNTTYNITVTGTTGNDPLDEDNYLEGPVSAAYEFKN
jgi:hypothetical protein